MAHSGHESYVEARVEMYEEIIYFLKQAEQAFKKQDEASYEYHVDRALALFKGLAEEDCDDLWDWFREEYPYYIRTLVCLALRNKDTKRLYL